VIYDVDIFAVPEQAVLSIGGRGPLEDIGRRTKRLRELAAQAGLTPSGPMAARFYGDADAPAPEYDVCLPVALRPDGSVPDRLEEARGELVPLHHVLQAEHVGPHDALQDAWRAVREACAALGYAQSGPLTEVFVTGSDSGAGPQEYVTLVRLPYAR
jgi:effector-binding domain-containing protein